MTVEPDRVATIAHVTDHVAVGLARLTDRWQRPVIRAVLSAWLSEVQELEDAAWELLSLTIETASGDALDQYGVILGTPNPGVSTALYRALLSAAALAIRSSGTGPELLAVLEQLSVPGESDLVLTLTESFPATLSVEPVSVSAFTAAVLYSVLRRAVAGGVRLLVIDVPEGDTFAFSDTDETVDDAERGFSDTAGLVGGQLVGVLDGA